MSYLDRSELAALGLARCGKNVKISRWARIYNPESIELGDNSRIDDFCVVSGRVVIGKYSHVTPMCLVAGGSPGIFMSDFCTLAYGVKVFAQSDDYTGHSMVNSMIPKQYKNELFAGVSLGRQVVIGAGAIIFPGVDIAEGCAVGAMSLVRKSTDPWGIYAGVPAVRMRSRSKRLVDLERDFLSEVGP